MYIHLQEIETGLFPPNTLGQTVGDISCKYPYHIQSRIPSWEVLPWWVPSCYSSLWECWRRLLQTGPCVYTRLLQVHWYSFPVTGCDVSGMIQNFYGNKETGLMLWTLSSSLQGNNHLYRVPIHSCVLSSELASFSAPTTGFCCSQYVSECTERPSGISHNMGLDHPTTSSAQVCWTLLSHALLQLWR